MSVGITLYTRKECCLCEEMKGVVVPIAQETGASVEEVDVDASPDLQQKYGDEVPVLFINGRKAFKYRVGAKELKDKITKELRRRR